MSLPGVAAPPRLAPVGMIVPGGSRSCSTRTKGSAITPQYSCFSAYMPIERDTCSAPATRACPPKYVILPPVFLMRVYSLSRSALCGHVSSYGRPPRHSHASQSPTFATTSESPYSSATTAQEPAVAGMSRLSVISTSWSSVWKTYVSRRRKSGSQGR
jgi:hypothetical protein